MGLIYVNPEGPGGRADPLLAARDTREVFSRMGMNDEETVALIAGGHTFGKSHGAGTARAHLGPEPEAAPVVEQGLGWRNRLGTGCGADTITTGLEGAWTNNPIRWDNGFFENLFRYEWEVTPSPAGRIQWRPIDEDTRSLTPDAHDPHKGHAPMMFTTDIALKVDPSYSAISRYFYHHPTAFACAFAKAWYKLTHRDMGPVTRLLGEEVPDPQLWQDFVPSPPALWQHLENTTHALLRNAVISELKASLVSSLPVHQLVRTAWASAATFRGTDSRGGANGCRIRLAPQKDWEVNDPEQLASIIATLECVRTAAKLRHGFDVISLADLIVLGGNAAIEKAAQAAGFDVRVPFTPGRGDATEKQTDAASFDVLEPRTDGFRNYLGNVGSSKAAALLVERAALLRLTASEMTVLVGGLRVLDTNTRQSQEGVLTTTPERLTNDFFLNLLDISWAASSADGRFRGQKNGRIWRASSVDLVFGSNSQLRAIAEYYACADSAAFFVHDFVAAWVKVMNNDIAHVSNESA